MKSHSAAASDWMTPSSILAEVAGEDFDERFAIRLLQQEAMIILRLEGYLKHEVPEEFAQQVQLQVECVDTARVVMDLQDCIYISSSALVFLVRFFRMSTKRNAQVLALNPPQRIQKLMSILGLDSFILFVEDMAMAQSYYDHQGI